MPKMRCILPLSSILQANLGLNPRSHLRNPLMRIYLTAGVLIGMLAGCSSADQAPVAGKAAAAAGESLAGAMQSSPAFRAPMSGFASLPDRGELLAYERSEEHTSELPSLMRISYAVLCLKKQTANRMTTPARQKAAT